MDLVPIVGFSTIMQPIRPLFEQLIRYQRTKKSNDTQNKAVSE